MCVHKDNVINAYEIFALITHGINWVESGHEVHDKEKYRKHHSTTKFIYYRLNAFPFLDAMRRKRKSYPERIK
jgi:hypothetical protein